MMFLRKRGKASSVTDYCGLGRDPEGFVVHHIDQCIGCGVFATKDFQKGDFLLEYAGEQISEEDTIRREKIYKRNKLGCFIYWNIAGITAKFCLVNDSPAKFANSNMKRFLTKQNVYLALIASKKITAGTEIRYDYGDAPTEMRWRKEERYLKPFTVDQIRLYQNVKFRLESAECISSLNNHEVVSSLSDLDSDNDDEIVNESMVFGRFVGQLIDSLPSFPDKSETSGRHSKEVDFVGSSDSEEKETNLLLPGLHLCRNNGKDLHGGMNSIFTKVDFQQRRDLKLKKSISAAEVNHVESIDSVEFNRSIPNQLTSTPSKEPIDRSVEEKTIENDSAIVLGTSMGEVINTMNESPTSENIRTSPTSVNQGIKKVLVTSMDEVIDTVNESPTSENICTFPTSANQATKKVQKSKKKIHRPCPYCQTGKMQSALTRHLKQVHKNEPDVVQALSLPRREQIKAFERLRKRGIYLHNRKELEKEQPSFIRERKPYPRTLENDLVICTSCNGFYSKRYRARHQVHCGKDSGQVMMPVIPVKSLAKITGIDDDDYKAVLNKMILDDISTLAKTDKYILLVGKHIYDGNKCKQEKIQDVEKRVRQTMRQLARLLISFKQELETAADVSDIYSKENIKYLRAAIEVTCQEENKLKHGLKVILQNTIKSVGKILYAHFLEECQEDRANQVKDFLTVFGFFEHQIFGGAIYTIKQKRNKSTRKPANLPDQELIEVLNKYLKETTATQKLSFEHPKAIFIEVRDAACARLTIYNGWRGGEPARLFIYQWKEALNGDWLRPETRQKYKEEIATGNRITFQEGKGIKLVPVFIPPDLVAALEFLSSEEARNHSDVPTENKYLFPSTRGSDNHVSGWHSMLACCRKSNLDDHVNGTMNRHRVATLVGALGLPESDRELAFQHFGHSGDVNRNIYQAPPAEKQLESTGKYLQLIDEGAHLNGSSTMTKPGPTVSQAYDSTHIYVPKVNHNGTKSEKMKKTKICKKKTNDLAKETVIGESKSNGRRNVTVRGLRLRKKILQVPVRREVDSDDDNDDDNDEDFQVEGNNCSSSEESDGTSGKEHRKKCFKWNDQQKSNFEEAFAEYLKRDFGYPGRSEMDEFGERNGVTRHQVRTRIVNERAARKKRTQKIIKKNSSLIGI